MANYQSYYLPGIESLNVNGIASGFNIHLVFGVCAFCMSANQSNVVAISTTQWSHDIIGMLYSFHFPSDIYGPGLSYL